MTSLLKDTLGLLGLQCDMPSSGGSVGQFQLCHIQAESFCTFVLPIHNDNSIFVKIDYTNISFVYDKCTTTTKTPCLLVRIHLVEQ